MTSFTDNDGSAADFELFPPEIAASCQQPLDAALHTLVEEVNRLGRLVLEGAAPSALQRAIDRVATAVETVAGAEPNALRSYLADFRPTGPAPDGYDPLLSRLVHWLTRQCLRVALESDPRLDSPNCPICTRLAEQALDRLRDRRHAHDADPARRRAEDALAEHALDAIQAGCWEWNLQTQSSRVDARYARMLGYKPSALGSTRETSFSALLHPEDRPVFEEQLQAHFAHPEQPCSCLVRLRHGDGRWISLRLTGRVIEWDESGKPLRMAGFQQAVDPRTPERERGLICLHDHLTGLPNRVLLVEQLQHELAVATREKQPLVVIELAVADFDALRGQYGQAAADRLLTGLTGRMHETLRETTLMARVGEDRFVLVIRGLAEQAEATAIERLRAALRVPLDLDGNRRMPLQVAIGLSRHDPARQGRTTAEALLEQAQQALETAGRDESGQWHAFDPETDRLARDRRRELERIRAGLSAAEFVLHYQPTVNLHSGEVISLEGLARWQHPELGLLAPARFIPLIEDDPLGI
ncbi:MAG: diguanylate cyclase domain-containing protein, partial [Halothiobacillaceae bacterium]